MKMNTIKIIFLLISLNLCLVSSHDKTAPLPISYDVVLRPYMNNMTFAGEVLIRLKTLENESRIRLNSQGLTIPSVNVKWSGIMSVLETHSVDQEHERLDIKVDNLFAGNHTIKILFNGRINNKSTGFFATTCRSGMSKSWIGGAILEPVNGRAVFPSFDDNENKVPVKLRLTLNHDYNTILPIAAQNSKSESLQHLDLSFNDMNLDQIGWAFFPNDNQISKVVSRNGHTAISCRQSDWNLFTNNLAEEMSNYTGVETIGSQWIIMPDIPVAFTSSKNIIFIREHLVENSSYTNKNDFIENQLKVSEAYAQQLLGQQIRAQWWPDLWLTKGLAKFMSYKLTEKVDGMFKSNTYISGNILPRVLERESIPHPLSRHAHSKQDILSMYDEDLFERAALTLRMIEDQVGESAFKRIVTKFVNITQRNGTAYPNNLWDSLKEISLDFPQDKTIEEIMKAWITSPGYPVVTVKRDKQYLFITQESIIKEKGKTIPGYWWIPITVTSQSMRGPRKFWLKPRDTLKINLPLSDNWYMVNENGMGFYRVNYDIENWKNLSEAIGKKELMGLARSRILDDSLGLAEFQHLPYRIPLGLSKHLASEYDGCRQLMPWAASVRHLVTIRTLLEVPDKPYFNDYVSILIEDYIFGDSVRADKAYEEMLSPNRTLNATIMDTMLKKLSQVKEICRDNPQCYNIIRYFTSILTVANYSSDNILDVLQCFQVEKNSNNDSLIDEWINMYKQFKSATQEKKIMNSLSCITSKRQKHRLLDMFLNATSLLKRQDFVNVIAGMSYSDKSVEDILEWMTTNFQNVYNYFSGDMAMVTDVITILSEKIYNDINIAHLKTIISSFERNSQFSIQLNRQQIHRAMMRVEMNRQRRKQNSNDIISWLKNRDHIESFVSSSSKTLSGISLTLISLMTTIVSFIKI